MSCFALIDTMYTGVTPMIIIVRWLHQLIYGMRNYSVLYTHQSDLANTVVSAMCRFEINSCKGRNCTHKVQIYNLCVQYFCRIFGDIKVFVPLHI
ncbi:hypothetical protein D9M68_785410 [compost metagenome]